MTPRILIIDDDPLVRDTVAAMLEVGGFDVLKADNGRSGLELFRREATELVVTDIMMPEKEGIATIQEIRRERPSTKIIAISGAGPLGNTSLLELAQALGANEILAKPFTYDDLLNAVERQLAHGHAWQGFPETPDPDADDDSGTH